MLPVLRERAALSAFGLNAFDPALRSLVDRHAFGGCSVDALAHGRANRVMVCIRILLALERLDVPVTVLVGVVDDPGFLALAQARCPNALSD